MDFDRWDIHLQVGRTVGRMLAREVGEPQTDPTRWRDDPAAPIGADLILRDSLPAAALARRFGTGSRRASPTPCGEKRPARSRRPKRSPSKTVERLNVGDSRLIEAAGEPSRASRNTHAVTTYACAQRHGMPHRHCVRNGQIVERPVDENVKASLREPTRWRDDRENRPIGVDLVLRAARRSEPPTRDDLARLAISLGILLRRPAIARSRSSTLRAKQRRG
jgi:hypothetical protein